VISFAWMALALAAEPTTTPPTDPVVPAPEAAPPSEPPPLTAEERQRLQDFRFKTLSVEPLRESFRVRDGLGATLGVSSFAKTTNDSDTLAHLARDRQRASVHRKALVYTGVGLVLASATTLVVGLPGREPQVREDVAYTALFLGLSGGLVWWISPMAEQAKESPPIDQYYTRAQAESRAESFNEDLRARLGIDAIQPPPAESP
jgi:hypothetical protein